MRKRSRKNSSIIVRLLVIGLSVYMIATLVSLWDSLHEKQEQYSELQQQLSNTQVQIDELTYLLEDGSQAALIEKAARERLGYEYSDATVYIDKSGS